MKKINIIALTRGEKSNNVGDDNNALGTARASEISFQKKGYITECTRINISIPEELQAIKNKTAATPKEQFVIIGAGESCIEPLHELSGQENVYTSISCHQPTDKLIGTNFDTVAIPLHCDLSVLKGAERNFKNFIRTTGVPHNLQQSDLDAEYKKLPGIKQASKYIVVVLGGDAPTDHENDPQAINASDKKVRLCTPEYAKKLGEYIGNIAANDTSTVIVIDSPRTGLYAPDGTLTKSHERVDGKFTRNPVSEAFMQGMHDVAFLHREKTQMIDFIKGEPSYYKAVLGAAASRPGSVVYMAGESTSMISESCDNMPADSVIICQNPAMNPGHHAHVQSVFDAGYASILDYDGKEFSLIPIKEQAQEKLPSAAETIASNISENVIYDISMHRTWEDMSTRRSLNTHNYKSTQSWAATIEDSKTERSI